MNKKNKLIYFSDLKISKNTTDALSEKNLYKLTSIQKIAIPPSLKNRDIIGSSKTGTGKTLCYIVPIIEKLWCKNWTVCDSTGALIISPTRELAVQIFALLKNLVKYHIFNSKLFIGGIKNEKTNASVLVATPGNAAEKILDSPFFDLKNLKIIAFDEADLILDSGFKEIIDFIVEFLPKKIQTLIYSATINSKIRNLAILNLKKPIFCFFKKKNRLQNIKTIQIPKKLYQFFCFAKIDEKFTLLISFLNANRGKKILVFFSTRKQVKLYYELSKKFFPKLKIFFSYGKMNQAKRIQNFVSFNESDNAIFFTTDLFSRGLDFKSVDWVIHFDCPSNFEIFVHRNGRTCRFGNSGKTLIFLLDTEWYFLKTINRNGDRVSKIFFSKNQIIGIEKKIKKYINTNQNLLKLALETFLNFLKFIFYQKNKKIFKFGKIKWQKYAESLGLSVPIKSVIDKIFPRT